MQNLKRDIVSIGDKDFFENFNPDTNNVHWVEVTRNMYNQLHKMSLDYTQTQPKNIMNIPLFNGVQIKWNDLIPSDDMIIVVYSECEPLQDRLQTITNFLEKYSLK